MNDSKNTDQARHENQGGYGGRNDAMQVTGGPGHLTSHRGFDPFETMERFARRMDQMFEDFGFRGSPTREGDYSGRQQGALSAGHGAFNRMVSRWSPQLETFERDDKLVVRADLPGMKKEDINLEFDADGGLTLSGERRSEHESTQEDGSWRSERSYGSFSRTLKLPRGVDADTLQASYNDGVLEVTMDKPSEDHGRKKIEVS